MLYENKLYENNQKDIELCSQVFPNMTWLIESDSPNRVVYQGKFNSELYLQIEGNLEGYTAFLMWNNAIVLASQLANPSLLVTLQDIKQELKTIQESWQ